MVAPLAGRYLPTLAKWLGLFVLALNARSLPFMWHFRTFRPIFYIRARFLLFRLRQRLLFHSRSERKKAAQKWLQELSPIGEDPIAKWVSWRSFAGFDDCDYNLHLSNSCYPKNMDAARLTAAMAYNPAFFRAGGWMALGATHFNFIREIPMFSRYEVRMSIVAWDQKWVFVISRFVTFPKKKPSSKKLKPSAAQLQAEQSSASASENEHMPAFASVHTPASGTATPLPPSSTTDFKSTPEANAAMQALAASQASMLEPDGATLNCVSVAEMCYKHGRITVPPGLVMACDGFSVPSNVPGEVYSKTNPPPHWKEVQKIYEEGGMKGMAKFLRGGWRDVQPGEDGKRWFERAMGGSVEERRARNLALVEGVKKGLEGAREASGSYEF
ncbi:uncharacterized protein STEHIDRAFT_61455 [Stereum hirsutum FP-91666 SS1]|uniref:uncharacterized protein n=1 Tax=Stereum hirsutum (strain FP-91666) TaxID=721885 RepID=UPI0004449C79|nr:uncharacterized protein STEHIDRAFT_61455 [Stereum hirsutum FP-91666 SS1]EIM84588.1 hypothetical protein STEHIDRAFT_61455 [Stereum hirsutum FP-91666 SS1]